METTPAVQLGPPRTDADAIRPVDPPRPVLIDLGALYGRQAHFRHPHVLAMARLHHVVAAYLDAWVLAETGWFGACRYHVMVGFGHRIEQQHLVPAWALKQPNEMELRQAEMRGELSLP